MIDHYAMNSAIGWLESRTMGVRPSGSPPLCYIYVYLVYIFSFAGGKTTILVLGGRPVQQLMKNLINSRSKLTSTPMARTAETTTQRGDDRAMRIAVNDCRCQFSSGIKPIKCVVKMSSGKLGLRMRLLARTKKASLVVVLVCT